MLKKLIVICLSFIAITFWGMYSYYESKIINQKDTVNYTSEEATTMFTKMYGMENLEKQNVYMNNDILYLDFYYNKQATDSELDTGRSFVLINIVLGKTSPYGDIPYRNLIDPLFKETTWSETVCNVYRGNGLVWNENYKGMTLISSNRTE